MRLTYTYKTKKYIFVWFENEHGNNKIILVSNPGTDREKLHYIKCNNASGYSIKINKKSLSSDGAAAGVMKFLKWSISNDIATCYINNIINQFAA